MRSRLALALAAPFVLAGCGIGDDPALNPFADSPTLPCPTVRVLSDGETYLRFAPGAAPSRETLELRGGFVAVDYECDYADSSDGRAGMDLDLAVVMSAERGPAATAGGVARLPYFVAVVGPDRAVVDRKAFEAAVEIGEDQGFGATEAQEVSLSFPPGAALAPWQYEVVLSFQLDEAALAYVRGLKR